MKQAPAINLLPRDPFYDTPAGKILSWASNIGKYILMFTQLVVLLSFAARFKLDRDLTDINLALVQKSAVIDSFGTLERDVRTIQKKTKFLTQYANTKSPGEYLDLFATLVPPDVKLKSIQFGTQQIAIAGVARTADSLSQFIINIQANPSFNGLAVNDIKNDDVKDPGLTFTMDLALASSAQGATR